MTNKNSSHLDTLETNSTSRPPESYRRFCMSHCTEEYQATIDLYNDFDRKYNGNRSESLLECRTGAWFARNEKTGRVRVLSSSCKLRWCPMCAATRRWFLTQQVSQWLSFATQPKFLTLTLKHEDLPIFDQIDFLYTSFQKYRKLNIIKRNVKGGVWFFQIHKASTDELWHPHLHCVIDSPWIDKFELSTAWEVVTKTSKIISIKEVKDAENMAEYVARYAARPSILKNLIQSDRLALAESLHGRRLVGTWGTARSISLRPSKPPDSNDWKNIGKFSTVMLMLGQDDRADDIWNAYKNDTEIPVDCNLREIENALDGVQKYTPWTVEENYQQLLDFY